MKNRIPSLQPIHLSINGLCNAFIFLFLFFSTSSLVGADKEPIGKVITTVGTVKAVSSEKQERALKRGDSFYTLEKILVDAASKVQLKFLDGGIINLIASTEYQVDAYVKKDGEKGESISTLTKGGFRAISGSIGKENPDGVKIKTPIATIGLRGTTYRALLQNDNLDVGCEYGTVSVQNDKGEINIGPTSDTLYSTVALNEAPVASLEEPAALAETSFAVEGGESFGTEPGEEEAGSGEVGDDQEPLSEDSDEETSAESKEEGAEDTEAGEEEAAEEEEKTLEEEETPEDFESEEPETEEETETEEELEVPEEESTPEEESEEGEAEQGEETSEEAQTEQSEEGAGETGNEEETGFDGESGSTEESSQSESSSSEESSFSESGGGGDGE